MRLFIGIPLPEEIRQRLNAMCSGLPGARWVRPENLHITLRFIGEVDDGVAEDLDSALLAIRTPGFVATINGIGSFSRGRRVHTLWAAVDAGEAIVHLHEKVESAVVRSGFEPEGRKFTPHVTLARLKRTPARRIGDYMESHGVFFAGPFTADRFTLFRSHLGHSGAYYEALADYRLDEP
jgi:RNA 2',3'-cyclic 3'-phosphodiesterase